MGYAQKICLDTVGVVVVLFVARGGSIKHKGGNRRGMQHCSTEPTDHIFHINLFQ
jgi:hypothetical protein